MVASQPTAMGERAASRPGWVVAVLAAALSAAGFAAAILVNGWARYPLAAALVLLTAATFRAGLGHLAHVALLGSLVALVHAIPWLGPLWPAGLGVAIACYLALARVVPGLRQGLTWPRLGTLRLQTSGLVALTALLSGLALLAWLALARPDVEDLAARLPAWPPALLVLLGVAFAAANAFAEEVAFRGVLQEGLERALERPLAAVTLQGFAFGLIHWHGFPRGPSGVVLATIYGLMLGGIRLHSGGLLAPWLAHLVTDLVIFGVLAFMALA